MAKPTAILLALLLTLNLLFFTVVTSTNVPCPPPPSPKPHQPPPPKPSTNVPCPPPPSPKPHQPPPPKPSTNVPCPPPPSPKPHQPPSPKPHQPPSPASPSTSQGKCPTDALKLGVCGNLLGDLLNLVLGSPAKTPCCSLIGGLVDLEAAVCLCTAIKANILGINLDIPVSLSLLLNNCGKNLPNGFQCQ